MNSMTMTEAEKGCKRISNQTTLSTAWKTKRYSQKKYAANQGRIEHYKCNRHYEKKIYN